MAFTRITNEDRIGKGNVGQPDTPLLTATEMQEQMDSLPNLAIDKHNAFLDELESADASSSIGCTPPVGITTSSTKLYGVLSAIAAVANASNALAHSHANKEALDTLTATLIEELKALNQMLSNITGVVNIIENDRPLENSHLIPTCQAVDYFVRYNSQTLANIAQQLFPPGSVYVTSGPSPEDIIPETHWTLIYEDLEHALSYYKNTT